MLSLGWPPAPTARPQGPGRARLPRAPKPGSTRRRLAGMPAVGPRLGERKPMVFAFSAWRSGLRALARAAQRAASRAGHRGHDDAGRVRRPRTARAGCWRGPRGSGRCWRRRARGLGRAPDPAARRSPSTAARRWPGRGGGEPSSAARGPRRLLPPRRPGSAGCRPGRVREPEAPRIPAGGGRRGWTQTHLLTSTPLYTRCIPNSSVSVPPQFAAGAGLQRRTTPPSPIRYTGIS